MRRIGILVALAALAAAPAVAAKPPRHGTFVPWRSLGGIRLGDSPATVTKRWGASHGVCDGCPAKTWFFTYRKFTQPGAGVEFRRGAVEAVYTVWQPPGWRSDTGLVLGAPIPSLPALQRVDCTGYTAFIRRRANAVTAYYVVGGKLWGFGLQRPSAPICR